MGQLMGAPGEEEHFDDWGAAVDEDGADDTHEEPGIDAVGDVLDAAIDVGHLVEGVVAHQALAEVALDLSHSYRPVTVPMGSR